MERTIAHLIDRGLRQARYKGTAKIEFQALATALVANLRRLGTLFEADPTLGVRWRSGAGEPSVLPRAV